MSMVVYILIIYKTKDKLSIKVSLIRQTVSRISSVNADIIINVNKTNDCIIFMHDSDVIAASNCTNALPNMRASEHRCSVQRRKLEIVLDGTAVNSL